MSQEIVLALDAMGGDQAPEMVIKGANIARVRHPNLRYMLFGNEVALGPLLRKYKKLGSISSIHHAEQTVMSDDKL